MYSEQVIDTVITFLSTRIQAKIDQQEIDMSLAAGTIPALKSFDWCKNNANETPCAILYDFDGDEFTAMTLQEDQQIYHFTLEFRQSGGDVAQERRHLLAYRDAVVNIIKENPDFGGAFTEVYTKRITPGLIFKEDNGYRGLITVDFNVEI